MVPGQTVPLHLDVPEFHGIERSSCPNWLLVAAHCSGIFSPLRVRNVTSVCYPATRTAGALAVYHPKQGGVHNVTGGTALLLDTDSHFHHSQVGKTTKFFNQWLFLYIPLLPYIVETNCVSG